MDLHEKKQGELSQEFPFINELIPVTEGLDGFKQFVEKYPGFNFCPYLADKTEDEWKISTSRQYMNQVLPRFLYIPVNIGDSDEEMLAKCIQYADDNSAVAAVNITKPHKSAPVLRKYFYGDEDSSQNVDTLIKAPADGKLHPFDLNAPAFINWFEESVGLFKDMDIVIVGAGGVGEPVAKHIDRRGPSSIHLVDIKDRSNLAAVLTNNTHYYHHLSEVDLNSSGLIVINASGKDGISDDTGLLEFIASQPSIGIFADLRPHLHIDIVEQAKAYGWEAYTGNGMNARNDYELLTGIMDYLDIAPCDRPSFSEFSARVAAAS